MESLPHEPVPTLRVARPTDRLPEVADMYARGLGFEVLGPYENHEGFDGIMLGDPAYPYHLEFTSKRGHSVGRAPTEDHLLFYLPDETEWIGACERMTCAGFREVTAFNLYWDARGKTFEDVDGYRVVLQHADWMP